uniref:(northern house mosquito) hypothetical protein n=1 Tax=Culex pipiens TaxID=7175 RepID=A0A8D8IDQ2_CULPI
MTHQNNTTKPIPGQVRTKVSPRETLFASPTFLVRAVCHVNFLRGEMESFLRTLRGELRVTSSVLDPYVTTSMAPNLLGAPHLKGPRYYIFSQSLSQVELPSAAADPGNRP